MKKLLLLFFLNISLFAQGAVVYIPVLRHKQDANKFVVLLGDVHDLDMSYNEFQLKFINTLLGKAIGLPKQTNIEFLFECTQDYLAFVGKHEKSPTTYLLTELVFKYAREKLPIELIFLPCDIRENVDSLIGLIKGSFLLKDFYYWLSNMKKDTITPFRYYYQQEENLENTKIIRGSLYDELMRNPEAIQIFNFTGSVLINGYVERLEELKDKVSALAADLPHEYYSLIDQFNNSYTKARDIITSYGLPFSTHLARLVVVALEREPTLFDAWKKLDQLEHPSLIASSIGMLHALLQSQQKRPISVLLAGLSHIFDIQKQLLHNYELVEEFDIFKVGLASSGDMIYKAYNKDPLLTDIINIIGNLIHFKLYEGAPEEEASIQSKTPTAAEAASGL